MYDLTNFTQADAKKCGAAIRESSADAPSMESAADRIVRYLYDEMAGGNGDQKACALVRFYKTHAFGELDQDLQSFARRILGHEPDSPGMKCLTLLGTAGDNEQWNSRKNSQGHKAIPLPSASFVSQIPMISRLINQFGVDLTAVLRPDPAIIVDLAQKEYNAFHVPEAVGSPYIPAQSEFVIPAGVQSVVGCGGMLDNGDLFALILFAKAHVPREAADQFKSIALEVKAAVQPFSAGRVFN